MEKPDTLTRIETALTRIAVLIESGEDWAWDIWDRLEEEREALLKRRERLALYLPSAGEEEGHPCASRTGLPLSAADQAPTRRARVTGKRTPSLTRPLTRARRATGAFPGSAETVERPGSHGR
jgi:hypothetical protein